jgi:hypothetical protein
VTFKTSIRMTIGWKYVVIIYRWNITHLALNNNQINLITINYMSVLSCLPVFSLTTINYMTVLSCLQVFSLTTINYVSVLSCLSVFNLITINYMSVLSCLSVLLETEIRGYSENQSTFRKSLTNFIIYHIMLYRVHPRHSWSFKLLKRC